MKTILVLVSILVFTALALGNYFSEKVPVEVQVEPASSVITETCESDDSSNQPFIAITPEMIAKADKLYADMMVERREIEAFKAQNPTLQQNPNNETNAKAFSRLAAKNQRLYEQIQNSQ